MKSLLVAVSVFVFLLTHVSLNSLADDVASEEAETANSPAEQILGRWVRYQETPHGRVTTVKDHRGDYTILKVYGPNDQELYSHRSEYEVDSSGGANIFRYRNKVILTGPDAGQKDPKESAYIFRVEGDKFLEVHGMLSDDTGKPSLLIWKRLSENTQDTNQRS